jgi:hypothetical protein
MVQFWSGTEAGEFTSKLTLFSFTNGRRCNPHVLSGGKQAETREDFVKGFTVQAL